MRGWRLVKVYKDRKSGKSLSRPGLQQLLGEKERYGAIVVFKLDRLARDLFGLLRLVKEDLKDVKLVFVQESIDLKTPMGRLVFDLLGSVAEWEREEISRRIKLGLAEAARKGVRLGAKPRFQRYRNTVRKMRGRGSTWAAICRRLHIDYKTSKKAFA